MADLAQLEAALRAADAAGDAQGARVLAGEIARQRQAPRAVAQPKPDVAAQVANDPISQGARNFAQDMPVGQQFAAGFGAFLNDVGDSVRQHTGWGFDAAAVENRRKLDAPLMNTTGGKVGKVAGAVTTLAPLALVPGANTVGGAALLGGAAGMLTNPATSVGENVRDTALGAAIGGGAQYAGTQGATLLGEHAARREALIANLRGQNAVRDETLRRGRDAGYTVIPSDVNPSSKNKLLESIAGKAAVKQDAAGRNQVVTNRLAREELGFPPNQAITEGGLERFRHAEGQAYRDVAALPAVPNQNPMAGQFGVPRNTVNPADDLEALKQARASAIDYERSYQRGANPRHKQLARALHQRADTLEQNLELAAQQSGRPELIDALRGARQQYAKSWDVERALNPGDSSISAPVIGHALDNGRPLTGNLETIGRFQQAFPKVMGEGPTIPAAGVSALEPLAGAAFSVGGAAATGHPAGALTGLLPTLRAPVRSLVLSPGYQARNAVPQYPSDPVVSRFLANMLPPDRAALLARALAMPSTSMQGEQ